MADLLISKSGTKAAAKGVNVASDFYKALDKEVRALIAKAIGRCKGNGRKTLRPSDL